MNRYTSLMPIFEAHPVLIFDGDCALCSRSVRFLIDHERKPGVVRFAPLQSDAGQDLLRAHGFDPDQISSLVFIEPGASQGIQTGTKAESHTSDASVDAQPGDLVGKGSRVFIRSAGTLRLLRYLRAPWRWGRVLGIIPRSILDVLYRALATNRYAIFGKADRCTLDERVIARTL